jgi:predicted site-specific integrase-resolvase
MSIGADRQKDCTVMSGRYSMKQAATKIGVHKLTLCRWEREGKIPPAKRFARKNERVYTDEDIQAICEWKDRIIDSPKGVAA